MSNFNSILDAPNKSFELAGIGVRFVAALIDGIIVLVVLGLLSGIGLGTNLITILEIALSIGYFGYFEGSPSQATFGKQAMGLKVVDMDGSPLGQKAWTRAGMRVVSGLIILIGFLLAFFNDQKQTLHDKIAGSLVVKK